MIVSTPYSPSNALPYPTISHLSQLHITFLFGSVWFLITQEVQFQSLIYAWVCGNPLEHGKPTSDHTLKINWVHLTCQWSLPVVPYLEVRPGKPLPHLCWNFAWLELVPISYRVARVAMKTWSSSKPIVKPIQGTENEPKVMVEEAGDIALKHSEAGDSHAGMQIIINIGS